MEDPKKTRKRVESQVFGPYPPVPEAEVTVAVKVQVLERENQLLCLPSVERTPIKKPNTTTPDGDLFLEALEKATRVLTEDKRFKGWDEVQVEGEGEWTDEIEICSLYKDGEEINNFDSVIFSVSKLFSERRCGSFF